MRFFTNLLFKVTLSSMVLTAPAMINGNHNYSGSPRPEKETAKSFYSSAVIRKYIDRPTLVVRAITDLATPDIALAATAPASSTATATSTSPSTATPAPVAVATMPVPEPVPAIVH